MDERAVSLYPCVISNSRSSADTSVAKTEKGQLCNVNQSLQSVWSVQDRRLSTRLAALFFLTCSNKQQSTSVPSQSETLFVHVLELRMSLRTFWVVKLQELVGKNSRSIVSLAYKLLQWETARLALSQTFKAPPEFSGGLVLPLLFNKESVIVSHVYFICRVRMFWTSFLLTTKKWRHALLPGTNSYYLALFWTCLQCCDLQFFLPGQV